MQNNYLNEFFPSHKHNTQICKYWKSARKSQWKKKSNKTEANKAASKYVIHIDQKHIPRNATGKWRDTYNC